ncbi:MAG: VPLPA-CTERM-specific exosortase XrtD [Pseudomonadota bacterium]
MSTSVAGGGVASPSDFIKDRGGFVLFLLCVLAPMPVFWFGANALVYEWGRPEYSHGPLIPVLSAFIFLREMAMVPTSQKPVTDRWPGVALVGLALTLAVLGNLARIPDIVFYSMIIWVAGLVLICFGFKRGLFFWPAVLHLVFMLPIPQFLYWKITIYLQGVSSELGVWFIRQMDIPVYLDGHVIDLGVYQLLVAEACSGLRYLFPIMSFSYIFCVLYKGPKWHKAVLLLSAVPIAVFMNSFRIGMIGVLVNSYGIEHAEGFLHYFEGWVIFGACIAMMFGLARVMQKMAGDRRPLSEALDLEFTEIVPQARRALEIPVTRALGAAAGVALAFSAAWTAFPGAAAVGVDRVGFDRFPRQMSEWRGQFRTLDPGVARVLAADDYLSSYFINTRTGAPVDLFVAYYDKQTEGSGIHSPEVCLPAGGWEMFDIQPHLVTPSAETGYAPFEVNRAIIQKGSEQQLVYYWFEQAGLRFTNDFVAKGGSVWNSITRGRTDGALIRLMTPLPASGEVAAAEAELNALLDRALMEMQRFVPE